MAVITIHVTPLMEPVHRNVTQATHGDFVSLVRKIADAEMNETV